jgi:tetratricopeptide (TPR) repeat protein
MKTSKALVLSLVGVGLLILVLASVSEDASTVSTAAEGDNYNALKLLAKRQLTEHRFAEALETARQAQTIRNDDHDVWGQITDALVELGDYPAAVKAAQTMVDLRPESSSYARVSYLRSLHGDSEGALQAMSLAVRAANPKDREGLAWYHTQLGNELLNAGRLDDAEREFDTALSKSPNHELALDGKARARIAAGDLQSAMAIYQRQNGSADAAQALGDLYKKLGNAAAAEAEYTKFETLERKNAETEKSWHHMINFWLDHDRNLSEALKLATREYETRKDIFTCDSLAWALFKNGRVDEARLLIAEALRTGSKDARITSHARTIN